MQALLEGYVSQELFDEFADERGEPRPHYRALARTVGAISTSDFRHRVEMVNSVLLQRGVTFTVYSDARGTERILPFDLLPRIIPVADWTQIARGIAQRVRALNAFLHDVYHEQRILLEGKVPYDLVYSSAFFNREMLDVRVAGDVYIHVSGIDLIRDVSGRYLVLEDNLRTPSGISYVLENRDVLKRSFPQLFAEYMPLPVDDYPIRLREALRRVAPATTDDPTIAILTPGIYNSAYFEHTLLARRMGVELVEGQDLIVHDNVVYMRTTRGLSRVDVIYRRVDDDYLDPLFFRPDSALGAAGLFNAYRAGNVTIANAVGTGVADDKAVYPYVPAMIRFYLSEEPILDNVPTYDLGDLRQRRHVIEHLHELVVKRATASGGYGMLMGPASTAAERAAFADAIEANPREFIAQPVIQLSSHPTIVEGEILPRRVDLRPFVLYGDEIECPPAALTRVALENGSLVVNSSQGGGSKDTWILGE
ncbi:MAG: circularly permuted type 2 ATP-grasp protein [Candidatus Eremiobacteraeota bacterium]|nr:circularly permuted type 2 ATP-grasp protein [Candidatus Eremiobacteraeota bacterium]